MDKVRWGLISTARINRRLIPPIRASRRGMLAAVASRDWEKAQAYADEWKIPSAFGSYEEMLASDAVDAVYISLPNHLHAEWTIRALRAGKHVLCEKPFAIQVEEVDRMAEACRESGRVLQEAFMYRHHPQTKLAEEWVRTGRLGEVTLVRGFFSFYMGSREGNVRLNPAYGGGALWDVGVYPLSFAQLVFGRAPERVAAEQWIGDTGVDESFHGQMHYGGGQTAQIACSFRIPFATSVEIHGTLGRIEIAWPFLRMDEKGSALVFTPTDGEPQETRTERLDPYLGEVENMNAAILDGRPTLISLQESRDHVRTALALYRAAQTGQMVALD
jgi:predicted dehydrogenase